MDEHDVQTNADVWSKFNYATGQFELWKEHVSRKYGISATDRYTSGGDILRNVSATVAETINPDVTPGTATIPPAFTQALDDTPEQPA